MKTRSVVVMLCAALAAAGAGRAVACGYHPGLSADTFDAVHPNSLAVAVALHRAQGAGVLPAEPAAPGLRGFPGEDYRRAVRNLQALQARLDQLAAAPGADGAVRFSLVFVRTRLWSQYTVRPDGASVDIHSPAAAKGETVVLSDESVLSAIEDGRLAFSAALNQGLVQIADDPGERARIVLAAAFETASAGQ